MAKTVLSVLKEKIIERRDQTQTYMSEGGAKNFPEYTGLVGRVAAYEEAISEITDLEKQLLEDNDDE